MNTQIDKIISSIETDVSGKWISIENVRKIIEHVLNDHPSQNDDMNKTSDNMKNYLTTHSK